MHLAQASSTLGWIDRYGIPVVFLVFFVKWLGPRASAWFDAQVALTKSLQDTSEKMVASQERSEKAQERNEVMQAEVLRSNKRMEEMMVGFIAKHTQGS